MQYHKGVLDIPVEMDRAVLGILLQLGAITSVNVRMGVMNSDAPVNLYSKLATHMHMQLFHTQ